ncbi:MAG: stage II sporulation protein D [Bacillota bacterium]
MLRAITVVFLSVVVVLIGIPALVVGGFGQGQAEPQPEPYNPTIRLYLGNSKQVISIGLEDYIKGVVAAEMPASFELEALKAQAVAARTYVVKRARLFGGSGCDSHPQADVCDNPAHCQAWVPTSELQQRWGMIDYQTYWGKISSAVAATAGEIITYQGVAIDPVFHSTCGGRTEDAGNVWQKSLPYLQPVECTYCAESPKLHTEQRYSLTAFLTAVVGQDAAVQVMAQQAKSGTSPLGIRSQTSTGRVASVSIGSRTVKATELRYLLGLYSTNFTCELEGDSIVFHVQGYGHGVGMCQYGADGMAAVGHDYRQIINHYYRGTMIANLR